MARLALLGIREEPSAARLAGAISVALCAVGYGALLALAIICPVVVAEPATLVYALARGGEVVVRDAFCADVLLIAAGTVCYGAHYTGCSISAGLLVTVTSEALERG